jgi:dsDNA-binding SOS-regulon protein
MPVLCDSCLRRRRECNDKHKKATDVKPDLGSLLDKMTLHQQSQVFALALWIAKAKDDHGLTLAYIDDEVIMFRRPREEKPCE